MKKGYLLLLATALFVGSSQAQIQPCGSDEMHREMIRLHPEIAEIDAAIEKQLQEGMRKIDFNTAKKTTGVDQSGNEDFWYDIPIVVHIVHDYNFYNTSSFSGDFIPDDFVFKAVKAWNVVFAKQNADTSDVIPPFKKWVGNAHIRLHLATRDPHGNPTKGITRRRSYLTYDGGQQAKYDDWAPTSYINIWFINKMSAGSTAAAYAHFPSDVTYIPFYDGVISLAEYMNKGSKTINHELAHSLGLGHVWGNTNNPGVACGDDGVEDTPPTLGHSSCGATALYDTSCCRNYYVLYTDDLGNIQLINYPDTTNTQNIMDYSYCDKMFTKGQCKRMHLTLNNSIAGRNNLWDSLNLIATGALAPMPDLKPIPEFTVANALVTSTYLTKNGNFAFPGENKKFTSHTQNDTVTALAWSFSNGATSPTSNSTTTLVNAFSEPGWVSIKLTATGNNSGDSTIEFKKTVFVADNTATNAAGGYYMEFAPGAETDKWPMFNYYENEFKWQHANVGVYDGHSMMYTGFDNRVTNFSVPYTGTPKGDFDDMFSVPVDVTGFGTKCNLNFHYTGASRSSSSSSINDSLFIDYCAYTVGVPPVWVSLSKLGKGDLFNKGSMPEAYTPASILDWAPKTIPLPAAAITPYTTFRFRYKPGVSANGVTSSGNNFYMDRVHFSPWPAEASNIQMGTATVSIVPNPTHGDAFVIVKDADHAVAKVTVSDITGKVVYTTEAQIKGTNARILIPASAITVQGIYLVQTLTGSQVNTQKLVVY